MSAEPCPTCGASALDLILVRERDERMAKLARGEGDRPLLHDGSWQEGEALITRFNTGTLSANLMRAIVAFTERWLGAIRRWCEEQPWLLTDAPPIVRDTREKDDPPLVLWVWRRTKTGGKYVPCPVQVDTMPTGDYAPLDLTGLPAGSRPPVVFERKSAADLYGTLTTGHDRFVDEMKRAALEFERAWLVVECSEAAFWELVQQRCEGNVDLFEIRRRAIRHGLWAIQNDCGVMLQWCADREDMGRFMGFIADRVHAQINDKAKIKDARDRGIFKVANWIGEVKE